MFFVVKFVGVMEKNILKYKNIFSYFRRDIRALGRRPLGAAERILRLSALPTVSGTLPLTDAPASHRPAPPARGWVWCSQGGCFWFRLLLRENSPAGCYQGSLSDRRPPVVFGGWMFVTFPKKVS